MVLRLLPRALEGFPAFSFSSLSLLLFSGLRFARFAARVGSFAGVPEKASPCEPASLLLDSCLSAIAAAGGTLTFRCRGLGWRLFQSVFERAAAAASRVTPRREWMPLHRSLSLRPLAAPDPCARAKRSTHDAKRVATRGAKAIAKRGEGGGKGRCRRATELLRRRRVARVSPMREARRRSAQDCTCPRELLARVPGAVEGLLRAQHRGLAEAVLLITQPAGRAVAGISGQLWEWATGH